MYIKKIIILCWLTVISNVYASNHHSHPNYKDTPPAAGISTTIKAGYAGYCEIEIINSSFDDVRVGGVFYDGSPLWPFVIYGYESPHYVSLYYDGYCHYGMDLFIESYYYGYRLYSGFTYSESTIRIVPYLKNRVKAEVVSH